MKTKDLYNSISTELQSIYPIHEADNIAFQLLEEILGITKTDIIVNKEFDKVNSNTIDAALVQLMNNKPLQYVLGKASFYGREFKVDSNVLIPRNETEELVQLIVNENSASGLKLLDIGTGSGCIPITLFHELNEPKVEALDISNAALEIARQNAKELKAKVTFYEHDILRKQPLTGIYDVIVSNPPYVTQTEKLLMRKNVLDHEPHLALFVDDNDPLIFYREISKKAKNSLINGGRLYFEINENLGEGVASEMATLGFIGIQVIKDLNGKERIVKGLMIS